MRHHKSHLHTECTHKLSIISQHIQKSSKYTLFSASSLLNPNSSPKIHQISLQYQQARTIVFDEFTECLFLLQWEPLPEGRVYIVNVGADVEVRLQVKVKVSSEDIGGRVTRGYRFKGEKGVMLGQGWKEVEIRVKVNRMGIFSVLRVELSSINTNFKNKRSASCFVSRKQVKLELEEYLRSNKGREQQIIKQRTTYSSSKGFRTTRRTSSLPYQETVQRRRELIEFQTDKANYINHLRKMSPERSTFIKFNQQQFKTKKKEIIGKLATAIELAVIFQSMQKFLIKQSKVRIHHIKIHLLCKKFIKKLCQKTKTKTKVTPITKTRTVLKSAIPMLTACMHSRSKHNAVLLLKQFFKPYMMFFTVSIMATQCQDLRDKTIMIQRYWRNKRQRVRQRIEVLYGLYAYNLKQEPEELEKIFSNFMRYIDGKNLAGFPHMVRYSQILKKLMIDNHLPQ